MFLSDASIARRAALGLIDPFVPTKVRSGGVSHGLSSAGYDLRLGSEFISYGISHNDTDSPPLAPDTIERSAVFAKWTVAEGEQLILQPNQSILAHTLETITMPDDLIGFIHDKSTWARLFLDAKNTVIEPGWRGQITLELTNSNDNPIALTPGVGIVQILFGMLDTPSSAPYRDGKYQNQTGVQGPLG